MAAPDSYARLVLPKAFVEHFVATRYHEWDTFARQVTTFELERWARRLLLSSRADSRDEVFGASRYLELA